MQFGAVGACSESLESPTLLSPDVLPLHTRFEDNTVMATAHLSAYIEVNHLTNGHSDTINALSFSPDGGHLVSGGDDLAMCIWNVPKGQLLYRLLFDEAVDCVLWHPSHPETVIVGLANGYLGQVYGFSLVRLPYHPTHHLELTGIS